ncbi:MAG: hypothetical protein KBI01_09600 [Oscillospiraceae bacterium]|nr:hypothetical protein [Oscillospiraceae bacterium]
MDEFREISIQEVVSCLWNRKWFIIVATVAFGVVTLLYTMYFVTPQYQASIRLYVNNKTEFSTSVTTADMSASKSLVDTYITILQSNALLENVIEKTGENYSIEDINSMISAGAINGTEVFMVSITNPSPEEAAKIANAIADTAPEIITDIVEGSSVKIIDRATVPSLPVSPNMTRNATIGALLGFVLSCLLFILIYVFDTTIYTEDDIGEFSSLPILGIFSDFDQLRNEKYRYDSKGGRKYK